MKNFSKKRLPLYMAADFETTVYEGQTDTEAWACAYSQINSATENVTIRGNIGDFIRDMTALNRKVVIWFHNLKFDGSFIIDYLLKNGYTYRNIRKDSEMPPKYFRTLISSKHKFYSITICSTKGKIIEIRDSVKLIPFSLKAAAKAFKTKHQKLEMEYAGLRYANCPRTADEDEYIRNDVLVLREILEVLFKRNMQGLTIGSVCVKDFMSGIDEDMQASLFPDLRSVDSPSPERETMEDFIRSCYKGAWCYCLRPGRHKNGMTYDVNSLYSSVMHSKSGNYYPVGHPKVVKGEIPEICNQADIVWFVHIKAKFKLKEGYLPTIQIKKSFLYKSNEWLKTSDIYFRGKYYSEIIKNGELYEAYPDLYLTMRDYELFKKHYDVREEQILECAYFKGVKGLFDGYIDKWFGLKQNSDNKVDRTVAKLYLNNLYGKFASSDDGSYLSPYLTEDGCVDYELNPEKKEKILYIPIGAMVTSYARYFTITYAQLNYDLFIYADTDSLHMLEGEVSGIAEHATALLCWKKESEWSSGIFIRQKVYAEFIRKSDNEKVYPRWHITCAGMPDAAKERFLATHPITDFKYGLTISDAKLVPKIIPGGMILTSTSFTLRK